MMQASSKILPTHAYTPCTLQNRPSTTIEMRILRWLNVHGASKRSDVYRALSVHRNTFARAEKQLLQQDLVRRVGQRVWSKERSLSGVQLLSTPSSKTSRTPTPHVAPVHSPTEATHGDASIPARIASIQQQLLQLQRELEALQHAVQTAPPLESAQKVHHETAPPLESAQKVHHETAPPPKSALRPEESAQKVHHETAPSPKSALLSDETAPRQECTFAKTALLPSKVHHETAPPQECTFAKTAPHKPADGALSQKLHKKCTPSRTRAQANSLSIISISKEIELASNACAYAPAHEAPPETEKDSSSDNEPPSEPRLSKRQYFRVLWRRGYRQFYPHRRRPPYIRRLDDLGIEELSYEDIEHRVRRFFEDPDAQAAGHPVGWLVAGWDMDYASPSIPKRPFATHDVTAQAPPPQPSPKPPHPIERAPNDDDAATRYAPPRWTAEPSWFADFRTMASNMDIPRIFEGAWLAGRTLYLPNATTLDGLALTQDFQFWLAAYLDKIIVQDEEHTLGRNARSSGANAVAMLHNNLSAVVAG